MGGRCLLSHTSAPTELREGNYMSMHFTGLDNKDGDSATNTIVIDIGWYVILF